MVIGFVLFQTRLCTDGTAILNMNVAHLLTVTILSLSVSVPMDTYLIKQ